MPRKSVVYLVGTNTRQHLYHTRPLAEDVSGHLNGCYKTTDMHGCRSGMETDLACIELVCLTRREICPLRDSLEKRHTINDAINRPFPSSLVPLFQIESTCETIIMKMTLICMKIKLNAELIFALRLVLKQRLKRTRKWPNTIQFDLADDRESRSNFFPQIQIVSRFHNMAKGS